MALEQALTTGVSGMINHQLILDTVANNLANISTTGFKSSTVNFQTALNQTSFAGSAPDAGVGGRNPAQLGLGVRTSSIDVNMNQGSLQSTGRSLDLAIQGNGFFEVAKTDDNGNPVQQFYSRVGAFGFDKGNNLVDLSSGLQVIGKQTDSLGVTLGNLLPINTTNNQAIDAEPTQTVTFQGHLSSKAGALQGQSLTAATPLLEVDASNNSSVATENSVLSQLSQFNTANGLDHFTPPAAPAVSTRTVYVFGTKPNGDAYAGQITIDPWTDKVQDLENRINGVLTQGNNSFGQVQISNGTLTAQGIGNGQSFSLFLGERNPILGTVSFIAASTPVASLTDNTSAAGSPAFPATPATITALNSGSIDPMFTMPAVTIAAPLTVSLLVNGTAATTLTIPAGTYLGTETFSMPTLPNAAPGDTVQYAFSGVPIAGINVTTSSHSLADAVGTTYTGTGVAKTIASLARPDCCSHPSSSPPAPMAAPAARSPSRSRSMGSRSAPWSPAGPWRRPPP